MTSGMFTVVNSRNKPFVRVAKNKQHFAAGDDLVFLLGQDIVFPGRDPILTTYNCG
jgi:hypothetical protein